MTFHVPSKLTLAALAASILFIHSSFADGLKEIIQIGKTYNISLAGETKSFRVVTVLKSAGDGWFLVKASGTSISGIQTDTTIDYWLNFSHVVIVKETKPEL